MSDIKLFRLGPTAVTELLGEEVAIEKSLQSAIEHHAEALLGVTVLKTEYLTGDAHRGRIDSLGIDENGSPVIIEYKRSLNENVINQGLYYLNWLMDHQGEFELLVMKSKGAPAAEGIDWLNPRVICIAGDFTKFDVHAVQQIGRNIALVRYKRFPPDLLMLEAMNAVAAKNGQQVAGGGHPKKYADNTVEENLVKAPAEVQDWFHQVDAFTMSLGDDVARKTLKLYFAYTRLKNFACVEVSPKARKVTVFLKLKPEEHPEQPTFLRDVRNIGHFGTGDVEVTIDSKEDLGPALELVRQSYEKA